MYDTIRPHGRAYSRGLLAGRRLVRHAFRSVENGARRRRLAPFRRDGRALRPKPNFRSQDGGGFKAAYSPSPGRPPHDGRARAAGSRFYCRRGRLRDLPPRGDSPRA